LANPALFASVYLFHKYRQEAWLLILGFAIIIRKHFHGEQLLHVFTAAYISIIRTAGGIMFGILAGLLVMAAIWVVEKCIERWWLRT